MHMRIGMTRVDFLHEKGSLIADVDGLCSCFGLTTPEFEEVRAALPESFPCREGYLPLGAFLTAISHVIKEQTRLSREDSLSMDQLHELELRTHNYILLVGALGQDLLGSRIASEFTGNEPVVELKALSVEELTSELKSFAANLKTMGEHCISIFDLLDSLNKENESAISLYRTATHLLDMMHTSCWEYTRWYSLYTTSFNHGKEDLEAESLQPPVPDNP